MTYANMMAKAHQRHPKSTIKLPILVITVNVDWISVKNWKKGMRKQIRRIRLTAYM